MTDKARAEADKIIEDGLGEVARGMFRLGDTLDDPLEAYERGMSIVSVVRDMAFDFRRRVVKAGKVDEL